MTQIQQQAIEDLIDEKVQLNEFKKLVKGENIKPAEIDENINDLARQYKLTRPQFLAALTEAGLHVRVRETHRLEIGRAHV